MIVFLVRWRLCQKRRRNDIGSGHKEDISSERPNILLWVAKKKDRIEESVSEISWVLWHQMVSLEDWSSVYRLVPRDTQSPRTRRWNHLGLSCRITMSPIASTFILVTGMQWRKRFVGWWNFNPDAATLKTNTCCQPGVCTDPNAIYLIWYTKLTFHYVSSVDAK